MAAKSSPEDPADQARFVFKGTVLQTKAATMDVPDKSQTAIVRVDEVIHAPPALKDYAGKEITVLADPKKKTAKGESAVFYTNGWLYGDSIAVQALDQRPVTETPAKSAMHSADPVENLKHHDLQKEWDSADLVVSGRVTSVRLPAETATATASAAKGAAAGRAFPRSEHDPLWREAVIQVDEVHKGAHKPKEVVVRFPSSRDIAWRNVPKYHAGQAGVFLLHKEEAPATEAKTPGRRTAAPDTFVALHPMDYQPAHQLDNVRALLRREGEPR